MNEDYVARSAQLAMLLEVSAYPKPGNVDRTHDFRATHLSLIHISEPTRPY